MAAPASFPFSSTGCTSSSFSPSRLSCFFVLTTRPITRPSFIAAPASFQMIRNESTSVHRRSRV